MIENAIKAVVEDGECALQRRLDSVRSEAARAQEELEKYKALVADLVHLNAEVQESDYFSKVEVLKVGELVVMGEPTGIGTPYLHVGNHGGAVPLFGLPSSKDRLQPGRYRILLTMQKVGDL